MEQVEHNVQADPLTTDGLEQLFHDDPESVQAGSNHATRGVNEGSMDPASTPQQGSFEAPGAPVEPSLNPASKAGLSVKEASEYYQLSANSIRLKIKLGEISAIKVDGPNGPEWRIYPAGVPLTESVQAGSNHATRGVNEGSMDPASTPQQGSFEAPGAPPEPSLNPASAVQAGLSKEELLEALEDFRASFDRDFSPPIVLDRGQEIEGLQRELIDGQKMMMAMMADKLRDRETISRLEADIKLLPDLQSQAEEKTLLENENEALKHRLQETEATLSAVKQTWWAKLFGGFGQS